MKRIFFAATMLLSLASIAQVQNRQEMIRSQNLQKSWVKNIPFQALEISRGAGEIIQVERNPNNPYELYVALAESGVWYSENNGASFSPTFADFMTPQADAMAVDWDNHTLWVANHQGVFFKEQGKDWQATSPVGNILVRQITLLSPTNLCLSAMGEGDSIQGVLCTTDKGKNWNQTFGQVGVNELKKAPSAPETLFLAAWDCAFSPSNITAAGKQSGIYKSNNAGATWELITGAGSGFPQGNIGKISLAVFSPTSLYALVDNRERAKEDPSNLNLQSLSAKDFLALDDERISQYIYNHSLEKKYSVDNLREAVRSGAVKDFGLDPLYRCTPRCHWR